jgi:hypothetical protein
MGVWLEANCTRNGKNLRASLKKLEIAVVEKSGKKAAAGAGRGLAAARGGVAPMFRK